jgi:hypothetical protein
MASHIFGDSLAAKKTRTDECPSISLIDPGTGCTKASPSGAACLEENGVEVISRWFAIIEDAIDLTGHRLIA